MYLSLVNKIELYIIVLVFICAWRRFYSWVTSCGAMKRYAMLLYKLIADQRKNVITWWRCFDLTLTDITLLHFFIQVLCCFTVLIEIKKLRMLERQSVISCFLFSGVGTAQGSAPMPWNKMNEPRVSLQLVPQNENVHEKSDLQLLSLLLHV